MRRSETPSTSTASSAPDRGIVVVGTSRGGMSALRVLLGGMPAAFPLPIAIVQHRAKESDDALITYLRTHSALPVSEAADKAPIFPGQVYLAPADYHLLVESGAFALSTEGPVSFARPSIDVLFESAAAAYGRGVTAVVLTGANHDGALGARTVKARGGRLIVEDPATAQSDAMPRAAMAAAPDCVLPLAAIAPYLRTLGAVGGD